MQSSQRTATAMPSAISSLVFTSSDFGAKAAWAMPANAFITSPAPPRKFFSCAESSLVCSGQLFMAPSHRAGVSWKACSAARKAEHAIGRAIADESGQDRHHSDPSDPIPPGGRKSDRNGKSDQHQPDDDADGAIDGPDVLRHDALPSSLAE